MIRWIILLAVLAGGCSNHEQKKTVTQQELSDGMYEVVDLYFKGGVSCAERIGAKKCYEILEQMKKERGWTK